MISAARGARIEHEPRRGSTLDANEQLDFIFVRDEARIVSKELGNSPSSLTVRTLLPASAAEIPFAWRGPAPVGREDGTP